VSLLFFTSPVEVLSAVVALDDDPSGRQTAWMMSPGMLADSKQFKVFNAVVRLVTVDVVNVLPLV